MGQTFVFLSHLWLSRKWLKPPQLHSMPSAAEGILQIKKSNFKVNSDETMLRESMTVSKLFLWLYIVFWTPGDVETASKPIGRE